MRKDAKIELRITAGEKARLEDTASAAHLSLSAWIRQTLLTAAHQTDRSDPLDAIYGKREDA